MSQDINLILTHTRHENSLLKTELLHALQQHSREVKEIKSQYQLKVAELQQIIDAVEDKTQEENEKYLRNIQKITQENHHLSQKLKNSEDELCFLRMETINASDENVEIIKQKDKAISDSEGALHQLREKNILLEEKLNFTEVELNKERILKHELEITLSSEKCQLKQIQDQLNDAKVDCEEKKFKHNAELERYQNRIKTLEATLKKKEEELRNYLENESHLKLNTREKFSSLERNMNERLDELKQKHLLETHQLYEENNKLLQMLENLQKNTPKTRCEESEDSQILLLKLQKKVEEFNLLQKENSHLKGKVSLHEELKQSLTKEKETCSKLHDELESIVQQHSILKEQVNEMQDKYELVKEKLTATETQLSKTYGELQKERSVQHQKAVDQKLKEDESLAQLQSRIMALESQLSNKALKYLEETKLLKDKTRNYGLLIRKLRHRLESSGLKEKELEAKHIALKEDSVPSYKYRRIQQQLQEIINKHNEFKASLQGLGNVHNSLSQVEDLDKKLTFITGKLDDLESAQHETISALDAL